MSTVPIRMDESLVSFTQVGPEPASLGVSRIYPKFPQIVGHQFSLMRRTDTGIECAEPSGISLLCSCLPHLASADHRGLIPVSVGWFTATGEPLLMQVQDGILGRRAQSPESASRGIDGRSLL
jgi:hypothetical protein